MIWLLAVAALAADPELEAAVGRVTTAYADCQTKSRNVHDPRALEACEEAAQAVETVGRLLDLNPDWPAADTLPPTLHIYERNLARAVAVMERSQRSREPLTIEGSTVVAIESDDSGYPDNTILFPRRSANIPPWGVPMLRDMCQWSLHSDPPIPLEIRVYAGLMERKTLTEARAATVESHLIECGVAPENILVVPTGRGRGRVELGEQRLVPDIPDMGL